MSKLFVRHNEQGSISVNSEDSHSILRIIHQSQFGDIMSETEISLQPNQVLHVIRVPEPMPEESPDSVTNSQS